MPQSRRPYTPQPPRPFRLSCGHFAGLAILYGLAMLYCSLMLGPNGVHYVAMSVADAWGKFRAVRFIDNASDQRADWIANMMMTIPLAYCVRGALSRPGRLAGDPRNAMIAICGCIGFILAVKYAQLFFPPRTVTLNYITAQSLGAALGVMLFRYNYCTVFPAVRAIHQAGEGLVIILGAYSLMMAGYFLMPFDLALSPDDLATRLAQLPLSIFPGEGHNPADRALLIMADAMAATPLGMFLAVTGRDHSFGTLMARGIGIILPITILTLFVLSATPFAFSLVSRTAGVALGIWFMWRLKGKDLWKRHYRYARYVPIAAPVYVVLMLLANGLLSTRWQSLDQAIATVEPRQMLPLWNLYMASKAQDARNIVATLAMFAPIGVMIWLRRGFWSKGGRLSGVLAFVLSAAIEAGRLMRPGLSFDVTDPLIAAIGAGIAFKLMPTLWKMFEEEAKLSLHRDTYAAEVARAAQFLTVVEFEPRSRRRPIISEAA